MQFKINIKCEGAKKMSVCMIILGDRATFSVSVLYL